LWHFPSTRLCRFENGHCLLGTDSLKEHKCWRSNATLLPKKTVLLLRSTLSSQRFLVSLKMSLPSPLSSCFYKIHFNIILTPTFTLTMRFHSLRYSYHNSECTWFHSDAFYVPYPRHPACVDHHKELNNTVMNTLRKYTDEELEKFMYAKCWNFVPP
jgi:hypothetical protein